MLSLSVDTAQFNDELSASNVKLHRRFQYGSVARSVELASVQVDG